METVTLSLISHTNVGKTTLARTLLRRDVGEVRDEAHVTDTSESYLLIEARDAQLRLWDTPGFGDTARLLRRLRRQPNPVSWFLRQVWDRIADRPLWCSQQAARNIRDEADVVLYLVNASENPRDAGYVPLELEILTWIGRPVLLLLNQTASAEAASQDEVALTRRWQQHVEPWPLVQDVLALDAFARCWVQEAVLLERVEALLPQSQQPAMKLLLEAWNRRNLQVFRDSCRATAEYLANAAADRERIPQEPSRRQKRSAMAVLGQRLDQATGELMATLIRGHQLDGRSAATIEKRFESFLVRGDSRLSVSQGALLGGVVSGALGGLTADALAGGLTFGGGMVAGAILGLLGGAGLTRGYQILTSSGEPAVSWSPVFLDELLRQTLLRYLTVAHFGRGRGLYHDLEWPKFWEATVDESLEPYRDELMELWKVTTKGSSADARKLEGPLLEVVTAALEGILENRYPQAARIFD